MTPRQLSIRPFVIAALLLLTAAGAARAQSALNASPVNDRDFVAGLLEMKLGDLIPTMLKQPASNPTEASGLRDALVDAWLPTLRDDPDAYIEALNQIFAYSDRLFAQKDYQDYWGRACWSADFAQHLMLTALPDLYQAGDFSLLGFANDTQRRIVNIIAEHSFKMLERAEEEHYRLAQILRARPDFTTEYVNSGRWDKMQEYATVNIPYYRTWAIIYLLTQDDKGPYFKQFPKPDEQRTRLIKIADADIRNVLASAEQRQLSDDTLVMMHLAAADVALAANQKDQALPQAEKALTYADAQPYTKLLAMLTQAKVFQYTGQADKVPALIDKALKTEAAKTNPLNLVLCTDRMFDIQYQRAAAMSDPARQKDQMNQAFDIYVKLLANPELGQWKGAVQQFVEARYSQQIPPGFDTASLPPAVRFAAIRKTFDEAEATRESDPNSAKAKYGEVEKMAGDLLKVSDLSKDLEVETRFYLGFAQVRENKGAYAMQSFVELAEKFPDTQRGEQAIGIAVASLGRPIYAQNKDNPAVQQLYRKALEVLLSKYPTLPLAQLATYDYAAFLREQEQYQPAIEAYDKVPTNHPAYLNSRYERLACLGAMWIDAPLESKAALTTTVLHDSKEFVDTAVAQLPRLSGQPKAMMRQNIAGALLLSASVCIEGLNDATRAQQYIDQASAQFSDLPDIATRITGLKIRIFQKQGKFTEAEAALRQYMQKEPDKAGPLALGVLQSLNNEIRDLANAKQPSLSHDQLVQRADIAVKLADTLVMPWVKNQKPAPKPAEMVAYELMPAQSLLAAQQYEQALQRFNTIANTYGAVAAKNVDVLQGQAESLYGLKQYAQAREIYAKLIRDRQGPPRPTPLYDRIYWNAQMRFYQMMQVTAGDKVDPAIFNGIERLVRQDGDLGGEPFKTALLELRDHNAPR